MSGSEPTWEELVKRWLPASFAVLAAHNHEMAKGDRGVMMVPIDVHTMQEMLAGAPARIDPVWQPADEFIRIIKSTPSSISAESVARWEQMLAVMDPKRDVALFLASRVPDTNGTYFTRFFVTHDGSVPVN